MTELNVGRVYKTNVGSMSCGVGKSIIKITAIKPNDRISYNTYRPDGSCYGAGSRDMAEVQSWIVRETPREEWEKLRDML